MRELIRSAAAESGNVRLTEHARRRMRQRGVTMREVLNVLRRGRFDERPVPSLKVPGHWNARLSDASGVAVVVALDPDARPIVLDIITVMNDGR